MLAAPAGNDQYLGPQRSRRLSASGMRRSRADTLTQPVCLKEADAFQRLVLLDLVSARPRGDEPQRSRRLSASGMKSWCFIPKRCSHASKKQTPFSVWYQSTSGNRLYSCTTPQRSRRLSASGIRPRIRRAPSPRICLKEADAFQRLVSAYQPDDLRCAMRPQRSRRLSASGMRRTSA